MEVGPTWCDAVIGEGCAWSGREEGGIFTGVGECFANSRVERAAEKGAEKAVDKAVERAADGFEGCGATVNRRSDGLPREGRAGGAGGAS
ncbi:hypothetical protein GCM10009839_42000 [Catenulispora yoronensis]|uniref:Uncharacterized protein n=1 Tax=Catenulispora yoronensis TaxID=450799 RepID=A0ABP5FY79_9ACTN